jgi:antitoxin component YwqK of YwqJK toxin-antitoxin module/peroxiredoxin
MKTILRVAVLAAIAGLCPSCKFLARQIVPHVERWSNGLTKREGRLEGGLQNGDWTYYYESGQRRAHGRYVDDHQVGPWTYWFEHGGIEWTGAFDERGKRTGEWTFFHADGTTRARGRYVDDFEDGLWEFHGADGAIERTGQYDTGKLSGLWQYFHAGGKPKAAGICHRGQRIGPWQVWDEAGRRSMQDFGLRPGVRIVREEWPNGLLRRTGVVHDGVAVGRWTLWHENGTLRFCCTLRDGAPAGVFEARDVAGTVVAQGVFVDGKPAAGSLGEAPAVAGLAAEVARAADAGATAAVPPATGAPSPAATAVVADIAQQPERIPAPMQPSLTVLQEQERESYVQNYIEGTSPARPSLRKYAPAPGAPTAGVRRRSDLEGKPLPIDLLRAVDGTTVDLRQYRGKKPVLLVVLRGFVGEVCIYCIAQTEALARCRSELESLGMEVLVLYPGAKENEQSFERAYAMTFGKGAPPYRVFYDPDLEVVKQLGIAGDLAHPTTVIVDEAGIVQYAYVGEHRADRPAAKELIRVIKGFAK